MPPSSYAVITIDKHGSILSANQSAVKIFGYSQQEMLGQKINMLMPSPYAEQHDSYLKQYQDTKVPHIIGTNRVVTILTKRGETKNVSLAVSEAETARGTIFIGLLQKVEDTRVVVDTDSEGLIYAVKGNVFLTFGYHKQELLGKNISIFCPEAIRSEHDRYMKNYKTGQQKNSKVVGKIRNLTAMHKTSTEPIEISLAVKRATLRVHEKCGGGVIKEISGFRGTITPVENMEAMVTLSLRGQILTVSENFCLMFGYSKGEMEGKHIVRLMKENPRDLFPKTTLGKSVTEKIQCIHKDKSVFIADITIHRAVPSEGADSTLKEEVFVCKIGRTSSKKPNKELISSGDHLGMYTYGRILGSGYFGKVRMAYHRITGCKVAIKTLRKKQYLAVNMEYPPREITVLKSLDHPHLNRLYDTVELPDRFHLVLEYVEGKELCDVVESGSPTEDQIRKYWRQILLAVAYMHSNGIVHRDLKLENIIIDKNDNVKIIDFGFGNFMLNENHVLRTFCGSPDYAAPELFFGKAYNGFRVDCWSLGVLLFALFSKKFPFRDSTAVMNVELAFPPSIPKKGRDLISKILVKNAEERFTVEDMLAHPWTNIGYPGPPEQPLPLFNVSVDNEVLDKMKELGLETSTTVKSLQHREFNQFTTTYFLLKEKKNKRVERQSSGRSDLSEGSDDSNSESGSSRKRDECVLL